MHTYSVGIVGATGAVGREVLDVLQRRNFPINELRLFARPDCEHEGLYFNGKIIPVKGLTEDTDFRGLDYCVFGSSSAISRTFAPKAVQAGCVVVDNSSAFRMSEHVPLVIPAINRLALRNHEGIVSNPNCTTAITLMALWPLHERFKVKRVIASSYQSVSGAGKGGIDELESQIVHGMYDDVPMPTPSVFAHQIAFNVLPYIGDVSESGYTDEELKMQNEGRKIMNHPAFSASLTCVRVPVRRAHSISVSAEFHRKVSVERAREILSEAEGVEVIDEPSENKYPMPITSADQDNCAVGRIRKDYAFKNGLSFFVSGDQLLRGAALNAVEILEELEKLR